MLCRTYETFSAERQGFEPWDQQAGQRFSRPPRSTTPASLRGLQRVRRTGTPVSCPVSVCKGTKKKLMSKKIVSLQNYRSGAVVLNSVDFNHLR